MITDLNNQVLYVLKSILLTSNDDVSCFAKNQEINYRLLNVFVRLFLVKPRVWNQKSNRQVRGV